MNPTLQEEKRESFRLFDQIAGTYDFLNHFLSFGIDILWRRLFLARLPRKNAIQALDLATGTGDVALELSKSPKIVRIIGMDLSREMVMLGQRKVREKMLDHKIKFELGDGVKIPSADRAFDLITISFGIRNFSHPQESLRECFRVLSPGGRLLIMEFSLPKSRIVAAFYLFYFRYILPFFGNLISGHKGAYTYLNKTVEDFPYGEDFVQMMRTAGFERVSFTPLTFGIAMLYQGDKADV